VIFGKRNMVTVESDPHTYLYGHLSENGAMHELIHLPHLRKPWM
jgi:hypothetical protein